MATSGRAQPDQPAGGAAASPVPRRLRTPRWLNVRLVAGVLLVLVSVIIGARVVTAADQSDKVWAAAADLAAGTVLVDGDLRAVSVRLADSGGAYLLSSVDPIGRVLSSPIRSGELLPRSVLTDTSTLVDIALPVAASYVPPSLQRGQLVDVYALDTTPTASVPSAPETTGAGTGSPGDQTRGTSGVVTVVVQAAVVQLIAGRSEGALTIGTSTVQVVISVDADQAADIFAAIAGKELALAVRASETQPSQDDEPVGNRTPAAATPATPTN